MTSFSFPGLLCSLDELFGIRIFFTKEEGVSFDTPSSFVAPQVGLEPPALRLTAACSAS